MHRRPLLDSLAAYVPSTPREARSRDRIESFVHEHADCFERSLVVGHVTGSAWVVCPQRRRVLLTHHRKLDLWLQLGGHCDGDADVAGVAHREALEESGLSDVRALTDGIFDVDVHLIPARPGEPEHFHHDVRFLFEADPAAPLVLSAESKALAWVDIAAVGDLSIDESVMRMVAKTGPRERGA